MLSATPSEGLEARVTALGADLERSLNALLAALPEGRQGPQRLAQALGLDKVFTSRLLKATRSKDPIAVAYHLPGPAPLRRFLRAAGTRGMKKELTAPVEDCIARFEALLRDEVGDRSALDALISSWLPEARREFELRRKQAAYRALSQLKGSSVDVNLATVWLSPSGDGASIDVVWLCALLGLRRLRAGAAIKLATRRMVQAGASRHPMTLEGEAVEGLEGLRLDQFCSADPAPLQVVSGGESFHYLLGGDRLGAKAPMDLVLAEVNRAEMPRSVPKEAPRQGYVFAEIATPSRALLFDVLVHREVYPDSSPTLSLYDTALEGVADVNDRSRDVDRIDTSETLARLPGDLAGARSPDVPGYLDMLGHVFAKTGWEPADFRLYRCRIDYPLYGSQVVAAFDPPRH